VLVEAEVLGQVADQALELKPRSVRIFLAD